MGDAFLRRIKALFPTPTYTGTMEVVESINPTSGKQRAYAILKSNGSFQFNIETVADLFLVGGGGTGGTGSDSAADRGGGGGGGGNRLTSIAVTIAATTNQSVTIGGISGNTIFGSRSSVGGTSAGAPPDPGNGYPKGGTGASNYALPLAGGDGGYAFGGDNSIFTALGYYGSSGGGGGVGRTGGAGGSGVVIVRWGDWT